MADLILKMDYDITEAQAKQNKLNREFEHSQKQADLLKDKIKGTTESLEAEKRQQAAITAELKEQVKEAAKLERQLEYMKSGNASVQEMADFGSINEAETKLKELEKSIRANEQLQNKSYEAHKRITEELKKQQLSLDKQNAKTADIGDKILLNSKKQNKFTKAFEKSEKSATRFSKRIKSLIASALFFSVVTKAFTALRNEFGKMITETGSKTASLVSELNNNLAVLGRTLYESIKPHIEWLLEKLVYITKLITTAIAKALGKNIKQMEDLVNATKDVEKSSEKTTANFDTIQKINSVSSVSSKNSSSTTDNIISDEELKKTEEFLKRILPLVTAIGIGFAAWKITSLLTDMGILGGRLSSAITLIATGATLLAGASINWNDGLHNGENTLNAILGTIGDVLIVIGLIIAGVTAWPVLIVGALAVLGMWFDNFKTKVDKWILSLPVFIYELVDIVAIAAYGVWDFIKNLFKGLYEIFTGDLEKGLKRIGIAIVNLLIDVLNMAIQGINIVLFPIRDLIYGIGRLAGKNWNIKDVAIPKIPRIPQLATGAVIPGGSPFLAMLGDQPKGQTNIEAPLDTLIEAFKAAQGTPNFTVEATGSMSQLIRMLRLQIKQENTRASIF